MPIKNGLCLAFILFLSSISSYATEPPPSPTDFLNKGGLIDPLCIYEIDAHHTTSLKNVASKLKKDARSSDTINNSSMMGISVLTTPNPHDIIIATIKY